MVEEMPMKRRWRQESWVAQWIGASLLLATGCINPMASECVSDEDCPDGYSCEQTGEGTLEDPYRNECVLGGLLGAAGSGPEGDTWACDREDPLSCPEGHECKAVAVDGDGGVTEDRCVLAPLETFNGRVE